MRNSKSCVSREYISNLLELWSLYLQSFLLNLTKPDYVTRYYAAMLLVLNFACIIISLNITNAKDFNFTLTTIIVCGLNIFLTIGKYVRVGSLV